MTAATNLEFAIVVAAALLIIGVVLELLKTALQHVEDRRLQHRVDHQTNKWRNHP